MSRTKKVILGVVLLVIAVPLGLVAWVYFTRGPEAPVPTIEECQARLDALEQKYVPLPGPNDLDVWEAMADLAEDLEEIDSQLWKPEDGEAILKPDFTLVGKDLGSRPVEGEGDQSWRGQELAERCINEYRNAGLIRRVDEVAFATRGTSRYVHDANSQFGMLDTSLPLLTKIRTLGRVNLARARLAVKAGDLEEFTAAYTGTRHLARLVSTGVTSIERLVGLVLDNFSNQMVATAFEHQVESKWLDMIARGMDYGTPSAPFGHVVEGLQITFADAVARAYAGDKHNASHFVDSYSIVRGRKRLGTAGENVAEFSQYMAALVAVQQVPRHERANRVPDELAQLSAPARNSTVDLFLLPYGKWLSTEDQLTQEFAAVRLAIAIERFRIKAGHLPASLGELDPMVVVAAIDPWTGQTFKYRLARPDDDMPVGYLIYSVGNDGLDNDGHDVRGKDRYKALYEGNKGTDFVVNRLGQ
ncbi:MAG: hypothetical protein IPK69_00640 [Phycisphaerales bacterium]|nr:MAG: hypothetical protein IPK69_00640 [Phycisphaerales bacterium]